MRVMQLWRFPVKSLQGEQVDSAVVDADGVAGDRQFAIFDVGTGFGLTARRDPVLLFAAARYRDDDHSVEITLPDGSIAADDAALSRWLGRPVVLRSTERSRQRAAAAGADPGSTAAGPDRRYEVPDDFEDESPGSWHPFQGSSAAFHDSQDAAVSLASSTTIGAWAPRRFRTNVLLDGAGEDGLVGSQVALGGALLDVGMRIDRCVMVTRAQPGDIERDVDVLRILHRERQGCLAVGATVARAGIVCVGDAVSSASATATPPAVTT